jgi:hypothetical protein
MIQNLLVAASQRSTGRRAHPKDPPTHTEEDDGEILVEDLEWQIKRWAELLHPEDGRYAPIEQGLRVRLLAGTTLHWDKSPCAGSGLRVCGRKGFPDQSMTGKVKGGG